MYYFNLLHENTIIYYIKTKQSSYYLFFFMKVFTFVSMLAYISGFKCQRPNILGALKSDSTHHLFRNACTKSGSLRFSQFSSCWLILSLYILMSFDFPFVRCSEFGNFVLPLFSIDRARPMREIKHQYVVYRGGIP